MEKQITLKEFRRLFDMSCEYVLPKERKNYIEEIKETLVDIGCPNRNNTKVTLELEEQQDIYEEDGQEVEEYFYIFNFWYKGKPIWYFDSYEVASRALKEEGRRLYDEYLYRN